MAKLRFFCVLLALANSAFAAQTIKVDDDGRDCPGALSTIQTAVAQAQSGDRIEVCAGTYRGSVNIEGHGKDGLQLIAHGEAVIQGNHTELTGIRLVDVDRVTVRGFTVRDFGTMKTMTAAGEGMGNDIGLQRANGNTIEGNVLTSSDMMGIIILDSGDNLITGNTIVSNDAEGTGCGVHIQGTSATGKLATRRNLVTRNRISSNPMAGVMIRNAGLDNAVVENNVSGNGRFGITNWSTDSTRIEGNRAGHGRGLWSFPTAPQMAYGIDVRKSSHVTVIENVTFGNKRTDDSFDVYWDGSGDNIFGDNGCRRSTPDSLCTLQLQVDRNEDKRQ